MPVAHPVYGGQGWAAITSPTAAQLPRTDRILPVARDRPAVRRSVRTSAAG